MSTTFTRNIQEVLDAANPNDLPDALRKIRLGTMVSPVKVVVTGLTGAGSHDITTAAFKALATISGITLQTGENLPPIGTVVSLRVTAASTGSTVGSYAITDASGTTVTANTSAVTGLATLSDDGKTLGFVTADVTAFVLYYYPRAYTAPTTDFAPST